MVVFIYGFTYLFLYRIIVLKLHKGGRNMNKNIYYIEVDLHGYLLTKIRICEFESGKDYIEDLVFDRDGEEIDYYGDIAGDYDDLDNFLKNGSIYDTKGEDNSLDNSKENIYLEMWLTDVVGYYNDRYIGLMVG